MLSLELARVKGFRFSLLYGGLYKQDLSKGLGLQGFGFPWGTHAGYRVYMVSRFVGFGAVIVPAHFYFEVPQVHGSDSPCYTSPHTHTHCAMCIAAQTWGFVPMHGSRSELRQLYSACT